MPRPSWRRGKSGQDGAFRLDRPTALAGDPHPQRTPILSTEPDDPPRTTGYAEATTDDEGRFSLSPIAAGGLELRLEPAGVIPLAADTPSLLAVREGHEDSADVPLRRAVTVVGRCLEQDSRKPVAGISVTLFHLVGNQQGSQTVYSDQDGRYTFQCLPGRARVAFNLFPAHLEAPGGELQEFAIPAGSRSIELPAKEALRAAPLLYGKVVDGAARAAPGSSIQAQWVKSGGKNASHGIVYTVADDKGQFMLGGLGPDSEISITGRSGSGRSITPRHVHAGETEPILLKLAPGPLLSVAGRGNWRPASLESRLRLAAAQMLGFPAAARPDEVHKIENSMFPYHLNE